MSDIPEYMNTAAFGKAIQKSPQTIRARHCSKGEAFGVTPIKIWGFLLWPKTEVLKLLTQKKD